MKNYELNNEQIDDRMHLDLNELQEVDHNPQKDLKEKVTRIKQVKQKKGNFMEGGTIEGDQNQEYVEVKSIADASVDERSFENEGVHPIDHEDSQYSEL